MYPAADQIAQIITDARKIVIVQADNPDADSLGSALALEHILGDMGKEPWLYCAVDMPGYIRYLRGWDRVSSDMPSQFDASILVDVSTMTLLEKLVSQNLNSRLATKPCVVLDHHEVVENAIPFATVLINDHKRASTGELIYKLAQQLQWNLSPDAELLLMASILGDTQGLTNQLASSETYRILADFIDDGVDRSALEEERREFGKMPPEIYRYKAVLIQRTEFEVDGQLAHVTIPQAEINEFSPLYNPAPLIQTDMLQTTGVRIAIVFKHYADGKITGAIRCNNGTAIAAELAEHFGGGGHALASGFKVTNKRPLDQLKTDCLQYATELLAKFPGEQK